MKKILVFNLWLIGSLTLALANQPLTATETVVLSKKEFTKKVNKTFQVNQDATLDLENRFGEVNIKSWSKNEIKVDVVIRVFSNSESEAAKVFDRIDIKLSGSAGRVTAETIIGQTNKGGWWWSDKKSDRFSIDYDVYMPQSNNLNFALHHGNGFIGQLNGQVRIELRHSNVEVQDIGGSVNADIAHGNSNFESIGSGDFTIRHGNMNLKEAKRVRLDNRHSNVDIQQVDELDLITAHGNFRLGTVGRLNMESKHNNVRIQEANILDIDAKYGDIQVKKLNKKADCNLEFGGLDVHQLSAGFSSIRFMGKHADLEIDLAPGAGCDLQLIGEHAHIHLPENVQLEKEHKQNHRTDVAGRVGNGAGQITATVEHGKIIIDN